MANASKRRERRNVQIRKLHAAGTSIADIVRITGRKRTIVLEALSERDPLLL